MESSRVSRCRTCASSRDRESVARVIDDPWFYAAAIPAVLLVGIAKGGFGSGAGIFATPLMALTIPIPQAAAIMLPILIVMDVVGLWAYRGTFSRENLKLILVGGEIGRAHV